MGEEEKLSIRGQVKEGWLVREKLENGRDHEGFQERKRGNSREQKNEIPLLAFAGSLLPTTDLQIAIVSCPEKNNVF